MPVGLERLQKRAARTAKADAKADKGGERSRPKSFAQRKRPWAGTGDGVSPGAGEDGFISLGEESTLNAGSGDIPVWLVLASELARTEERLREALHEAWVKRRGGSR